MSQKYTMAKKYVDPSMTEKRLPSSGTVFVLTYSIKYMNPTSCRIDAAMPKIVRVMSMT